MNKLFTFFSLALTLALFSQQAVAQCGFEITASDSSICLGDSTVLSAAGATSPLLTTLAAGNNHRGNMFDIVALNTVTITAFDAHPQSNTTIEIYYRSGSYVGFEGASTGWTLAGSAAVVAQAQGTATVVPINIGVTIPAGQTYGFYVTSSNVAVSLNYTNGTGAGNVWSQDANIQFIEGVGMEYPFTNGGTMFTPRIFNGNIHYEMPLQYLWNTGDTTSSITVSPSSGTDYTCLFTDTANSCTNLDSIFIDVTTPPAVWLWGDTTMCPGTVLPMDAGNAGSTYAWSTGDTTQIVTASTAGTYSVQVTDANGCIGADTVVVDVDTISVDLGLDQNVCAGATTMLDAGSAAYYLWSTAETTQTIAVSNGTYYVDVTSGVGCTVSDTINVGLLPSPNVVLWGDTTLCDGDSLILDAGYDTAYSYTWTPAAGDTSAITVSAAGTYTVIADNGSCSGTDDIVVTVESTPIAGFTSSSTSLTADFTNGSTGGTSYSWDFGDGNSGTGANPSHTYGASGTYTVILTVSNLCGSDTYSMDVVVIGIGFSDYMLNENINVYPNPSNGQFTVEFLNGTGTLSVTDITGRIVFENGSEQSNFNVDLSNITPGVYFVGVLQDGQRYTTKVIIK